MNKHTFEEVVSTIAMFVAFANMAFAIVLIAFGSGLWTYVGGALIVAHITIAYLLGFDV